MSITVEKGDPRTHAATQLLTAHHALMQSLFPAESNHVLSADALCDPEITFLIAREGTALLGCGAMGKRDGYGEIKSMFVASEARGKGVADALIQALIAQAQTLNLKALKLETGDTLHAAIKLYEKHGFTYCGPFGDFVLDPNSLFMERVI